MSVRYFWLIVVMTCTIPLCAQVDLSYRYHQSVSDSLFGTRQASLLHKQGFPDAACQKREDEVWVSYTRSKFRLGAVSTRELMNALEEIDSGSVVLHIVVCDRSIPFYTYSIPVQEGSPQVALGRYDIGPAMTGKEGEIVHDIQGDNFTGLFSLDPQFRFSFGASPDPFQVQFNLLPRVDVRLWTGSLLRFQYIIPVWNELDIPEEDFWRPGLVTFSQYLRLGRGLFSNVTIGYFYPYRYGAQVQICKFLLGDRAFVGTQFGYTGYASYPVRLHVDRPVAGWQTSQIQYLDYMLTAGWRFPRQHVQVALGWGKGLFNQRITSCFVSRQFDLTTVELFAQQLDQDLNYGLRLRIPFPFLRRFVGKRWMIQSASFHDFYYNGTQNYLQDYYTGHSLPFLSDQFHPDMLF